MRMRALALCALAMVIDAGQPPACAETTECTRMCAARASAGRPLPFPCTAVFCNEDHARCDVRPPRRGQQGEQGGAQSGPTIVGNECHCFANEPRFENECERNPARTSPSSCTSDGTRTGTRCHWGPSENPECQTGPRPRGRPQPQGPRCPREMDGAKAACGPFIRSKCPAAVTDRAMGECYIEHRSSAPAACQLAAKAVFKCEHQKESEETCLDNWGEESLAVCMNDITKFCARQLAMGFRPTFDCMMRNQRRVSHVCAMESRSLVACVQCGNAKRNAFDLCMETFIKVCKDAKEGGEERCFRANQQKFPAACQTAAHRMISTCKRGERIREQTEREVARKVRQAVYRKEGEDRRREAEQRMADRRREDSLKMREDVRERTVSRRESIDRDDVQRLSENPMGAEGAEMRQRRTPDTMPGVLEMFREL